MHFSARRLLVTIALSVLFATAAAGQCPTMPQGYLCITQAAGNVAAENARELAATKDLVTELRAALKTKDQNTEEIKAAAKENETALLNRLMKVTTDYGTAQGQVIELKAANTEKTMQINVLLNQTRKRCGVIFSICL